MRSQRSQRVGVMFDRDRRPEDLAEFARAAEAAGLDDLWVVEDLGWAGAIASATVALAATRRIRVGLGIAPAPLRNPALLAMEWATLARLFPGRFVGGLGHGVPAWMRQVGAGTPHPLALLEETIAAVRLLLRGERVTLHGDTVQIDGVRLVHPPEVPPPIVTGVVGPKSLRLSGRVADGTVLPEGYGPAAVSRARDLIAEGRPTDAGPHETIGFTFVGAVDGPPDAAAALTAAVAGQAAWLGVPAQEVFVVDGPAAVRSLWAAGLDTAVLRPLGADPIGGLESLLAELRRPNDEKSALSD